MLKFLATTIKWTLKALGLLLLILVVSIAAFSVYCGSISIDNPADTSVNCTQKVCEGVLPSGEKVRRMGDNWLTKNKYGLWEMRVNGSAKERGYAFGQLCDSLLYHQEKVFMNQIDELVPNRDYQKFLKYMIRFFNKDLPDFVWEENQEEIFAMSKACSPEFDYVGSPYERQLNFHAAHDLGHAMQDYMLVGCTSFATWGGESENNELIVGRNFDFYVGDAFAENKMVAFFNPDSGVPFAMVTWPGMTGVCSGMNMAGVTVTINAAKSSMPTSAACPISLLARHILQYAHNIDEARALAKAKTFVSESILIGSAADGCAEIIEKGVDTTGYYSVDKKQGWIVCANHYQSEVFKEDEGNKENIANSDSPFRQKRAQELIHRYAPLNPQKAAQILRDKCGLGDSVIGLGNEKALNQLLGHHSVVFAPERRMMWVSTAPWQEGAFVAYDLTKVFTNDSTSASLPVLVDSLTIAADSVFIKSIEFQNYLQFRERKKTLLKTDCTDAEIADFVALNPRYYLAYDLAGDAYMQKRDTLAAKVFWKKALQFDIPKKAEEERINRKLSHY